MTSGVSSGGQPVIVLTGVDHRRYGGVYHVTMDCPALRGRVGWRSGSETITRAEAEGRAKLRCNRCPDVA